MKVIMVKWSKCISVYLKEYITYPANVFIKLIYVPIQMFIMYFLWQTLAEFQNLDFNYLINYYLLVYLILYSYPYLHISKDINEDIMTGSLSNILVRPISYIQPKISKFLAWMTLYSVVILIALIYIGISNSIGLLTTLHGRIGQFLLLMICGLLIEFSIWFMIGLLSFYIGKVRGFMILTGTLRSLLSGSLIPLALFPEWTDGIIKFSPFKFFLYVPVNFLLDIKVNFYSEISSAILCLIVLIISIKFIWWHGIKLYNNSMS